MGKEEEGEGNQWHGRVVVGGSRESERIVAMGAQLGGHGCRAARAAAARSAKRRGQRKAAARSIGAEKASSRE